MCAENEATMSTFSKLHAAATTSIRPVSIHYQACAIKLASDIARLLLPLPTLPAPHHRHSACTFCVYTHTPLHTHILHTLRAHPLSSIHATHHACPLHTCYHFSPPHSSQGMGPICTAVAEHCSSDKTDVTTGKTLISGILSP